MLDFTSKYLACVTCGSALEVEPLVYGAELEEGFLNCETCKARYPVVSSIPFLVEDLKSYFSIRMSLGGELLTFSKSGAMKSFFKETLRRITSPREDTSDLEKRWVGIYKNSLHSKFYTRIRDLLMCLPKSGFVLEHGCSIGYVARHCAKRNGLVFGIDKSFYGIMEAKRRQRKNSDFLVSDSLNPPFGRRTFGLVLALNLLDIVEPRQLIKIMSRQSGNLLVLSDPYDFERGKGSVKNKITPGEIRSIIKDSEFRLIYGTAKPQFIPWKLDVNPRLSLNYEVDLVVARRKS